MKIVLLTDTHFGMRNDNSLLLSENEKFFKDTFFPYIDEYKISTVIHLGDVVDRRKYINFNTANKLRKILLEPLSSRNINTYFIIGNHDVTFKNTNSINALRELFAKHSYPTFKIYDGEPEEVKFDDLSILFIPWITDDKMIKESTYKKIQESTARIVMGHLEIQGFEMYKGSIVSHGDDRNIFSKFDTVYSGHYHHKSTDGHIFYLGSHAEFTWSDYDDPKGFHVFDTETLNIEFIRNPRRVFYKIIYNDSDKEFLETKVDYSIYKDKYIKVIIKEKNNLYWFDKFIENLEAVNPYDIQTIEDTLNLNLEDSDIVNEAESTLDICHSYVDKLNSKDHSKNKIKSILTELHNEALSVR